MRLATAVTWPPMGAENAAGVKPFVGSEML
jgi:hypothetical protein